MQNVLKGILDAPLRRLVLGLQKELEAQGHKATGRLVESAELKYAIETSTQLVAEIYFEDYWEVVNDGVRASRIPYRGQRSGGKSKYIEALIAWAQVVKPGLTLSEAKSFAFAVANKHKEEGMPTRGSYRFSSNGRRTKFVDVVKKDFEEKLAELIDFDNLLFAIVERIENFKQA
jgi:hypothetical protein